MPLILDHPHPQALEALGIDVLTSARARQQNIAPLQVLLLDGDASGDEGGDGDFAQTLTGLLAQLSNSPLQVELALGWQAAATSAYDAVILTARGPRPGMQPLPPASASLLMGEAARHDLEQRHGIVAEQLTRPLTEIISHQIAGGSPLMAGQEPVVPVPVVRAWRIGAPAIAARPALQILAHSPRAGVHVVYEPGIRRLHVLNSLALTPLEFARQRRQLVPRHAEQEGAADTRHADALPPYTWRAHSYLLIADWLNNEVYQPGSWSRAETGRAPPEQR